MSAPVRANRAWFRPSRPVVVGLLAAVVLAILTACGSDDRPVLTTARVYDVPGRSALEWCRLPATVVRTRWTMQGPHYDLNVACRWAAGDGLDARTARRLGVEPVRAAPDEELLLFALDPVRPGFGVDEEHQGPVSIVADTAVVVDATATTVNLRPRIPIKAGVPFVETVVVMVAARPGAAVRLRVTDEQQGQEIDLRTGRVAPGPNGPYVERRTLASWDGEVTVALPGQPTGAFAMTSWGEPDVVLTSHRLQEGWAGPGRAFLRVHPPQVCCATGLHVELDDADVFAFRTTDGQVVAARSRQRGFDFGAPLGRDEPVVFDVPATTTAGTVVFDLSRGRLTLQDRAPGSSLTKPGAGRTPAAWSIPPAPVELLVEFS